MEQISVIFNFQGNELTIQCLSADKMKDICQKYSTKIEKNLNSLLFLYGGEQINFEKNVEEQASSLDKASRQMKVLVYKNENKEHICPRCGEKIELNTEKIDEMILSNNNIKDAINGIKFQIDNIINTSMENFLKIQMKNINILLNTLKDDIQKNIEKLEKLFNEYKNDYFENKNSIKGVLDIKVNEIKNKLNLFNTESNIKVDVYIDGKKVNLIKEKYMRKIDYNFTKDGKYKFEIVFNEKITTLHGFFENCGNFISLDFSNFDSRNVTSTKCLFNECLKLKDIKGMYKFITSKVTNMKAMFQRCKELEYLDLSSFDTRNVTDMSYMFMQCKKLKKINGINNFKTNKVTKMDFIFHSCKELEYLDLSNFDTSNVTTFKCMFNECNNKRNKRIK